MRNPITNSSFKLFLLWLKIYLSKSLDSISSTKSLQSPKNHKKAKTQCKHQKQKKRMEIIPQKLFNKITWPKKKSSPLQKKSSKRQITLLKSMDRKTFPRLYQNIWRKNVKKFHSKLKHRSYNIILQNFIHGFFVTYTHLLFNKRKLSNRKKKSSQNAKKSPQKKKALGSTQNNKKSRDRLGKRWEYCRYIVKNCRYFGYCGNCILWLTRNSMGGEFLLDYFFCLKVTEMGMPQTLSAANFLRFF